MSDIWLKQALIGVTAKVIPAADGDFGVLLERVAATDAEPAVVFGRVAGVIAAGRRASVVLDAAQGDPPAPAERDEHALDGAHPWFTALASAFADGPPRLQFEACMRLGAIGATLPHALLCTALDAGVRNAALREPLCRVAGHRGRWLARFNPDWRFACEGAGESVATNDPRVWEEGSLAQRVEYLRALRRRDAGAARTLLQDQLEQLPAKERAELIQVIADRLGEDDEPLLAPLLKDRSRDVRDIAARLLASLPQSVHAARLIDQMTALLSEKRGMLRRSWQLEAPQSADPQWRDLAIEAKRPQHDRLGERAWWLYQLVRQAPLSWWCTHTGMTPAELVSWAKKTDWAEALHRGWRERVADGDDEWIEALLQSGDPMIAQQAPALLALLPVARREKYWPDSLGRIYKDGVLGTIVGSFAPGETLSLRFSAPLLASLHAAFIADSMRNDYGLRAHAIELSTILHPDSFANWQPIPRRDDETPALAECIHDFERVVAIRRTLHSSAS